MPTPTINPTGQSDRELKLEKQLEALQQQNLAQSQQISALMDQVSQLTAQLRSITSIQTPVPEEEDATMEGGTVPNQS